MSKHPDTCIVVGCEGTVAGFAELTADFPLPGKGALAVVVSAILDALAPLGVRDITMPTTPFKVWQAIREARVKPTG